jgi:hypothetical protein
MTQEKLLKKAVGWFEDIAEMCSKLTSGNVAHQSATIRGLAFKVSSVYN